MADDKSIVSPLPGVFYRKPSPEEGNYVEAGQKVEKGDVIGLIEVMKSFHEITLTASGEIASFSVENEDIIDAGQEVAKLK